MASRGGYDGGSGAGGKIRRRPPSRAAAASPYARPAPAPAAPSQGGEGGGWLTRLIAGGASRLLSSVFRMPPPQLAAPPQPEPFDAPPSRSELIDASPSHSEPLDAPPSPPPPPLEDDISDREENGGGIANNLSTDNPDNSAKEGDGMLRRSDGHGTIDLEELLKQRTFTRSEFEYLAELLRSRTVGSNSLKPEVGNVKQMYFSEKENGSRDLPADFSIRTYNAADQVASPAELAKAYMGSRSSKGSLLRLRLHDPASPVKLIEANTIQIAKPPTLPLLSSSRLHGSTPSDHPGSNYMTPNRSAIYKMSSSPYFKSAVSSRDLSGTVSSSYQNASSVHTFGRQVLIIEAQSCFAVYLLCVNYLITMFWDILLSCYCMKFYQDFYVVVVDDPRDEILDSQFCILSGFLKRKSTALNNETVSVGPIRKMRQRYNRVSPLLETRPGYRGYLGSRASKFDEDFEHSTQTQKRQCLDKIGDGTRGDVGNRAHDNSFGQVPAQSTEMAAKILKQLDTLVPSQTEGTSETTQKHGNAMDADDPISQIKEVLTQGGLLGRSSGDKEYSLLNNMNGAAKITPAAIDRKTVDATSDKSAVLKRKSASEITSPKDSLEVDNCSGSTKIALHQANDKIEGKKSPIPEHTAKSSGSINEEKPPTFSLRSHAPSNLVLSSEIDRNKMPASSNGFSFPVPVALGVHSQAPPTPTMASPPLLPVEKLQSSAVSNAPVTSAETVPRILKPVSEEGTISNKCAKKLNAENLPISAKSSGQVASFTSNPVFSVASSKPATLSNGLAHTASSTASFPQFSFQSGFQTSAQQSGGTQVKAEAVITAPFSTQSSSTGGSFSFSNTGTGSSSASSTIFAATTPQSVTAPSLASFGAGIGSAPFSFSPQFGSASSLAAQDKSKAGGSSVPFSFSPQFGTASSFTAQDRSKASSPESTLLSGNQCAQSGNSSSLFTQSSASNSNVISSEISYSGSSPSFANSSFGSAPSGSSPFNSTSVFSFATGSGSTSVTTTAPPSLPSAASSFGSGTAFSASPIFGSSLTTTAPPSFGLPNTASAASPFSSTSSPVFSFTSATPTVPNPSPTTPIFGRASPTVGLSTGTDQMNGGHMIGDKNQSPFSTTLPFGLPSSSPSTPIFSTPATQLASTTSASPGIFQFGQQSQASSGGFSMGTGGGNDKTGRRILKVKRKK